MTTLLSDILSAAPSIPRPWWRVEIDSSGAILKCKPVEAAGQDGNRVLYFEAADANEAATKAKAWYQHSFTCPECKVVWKASFSRPASEMQERSVCLQCRNKIIQESKAYTREKNRLKLEGRAEGRDIRLKAAPVPESARKYEVDIRLVQRRFNELSMQAFKEWLDSEVAGCAFRSVA